MEHHLKNIQTWMYNTITKPNLNPKEFTTIKNTLSPSKSLTATDRLQIYRDSYFIRLIDCLQNEFSILFDVLGEELFNHLAWNYLIENPSTSYTLNDLGQKFPDYLKTSSTEEKTDDWQLFIIDLAKYERTYAEVFNGKGHENLESKDIFSSNPIQLSPAIRLEEFVFPVLEFIHQYRENNNSKFPNRKTTQYVFTRQDYTVSAFEFDNDEFQTLKNLLNSNIVTLSENLKNKWLINGICFQ